jgi:hypothetical protein
VGEIELGVDDDEFVSRPVECDRGSSVIKTLLSALRARARQETWLNGGKRRKGRKRDREIMKKGSASPRRWRRLA